MVVWVCLWLKYLFVAIVVFNFVYETFLLWIGLRDGERSLHMYVTHAPANDVFMFFVFFPKLIHRKRYSCSLIQFILFSFRVHKLAHTHWNLADSITTKLTEFSRARWRIHKHSEIEHIIIALIWFFFFLFVFAKWHGIRTGKYFRTERLILLFLFMTFSINYFSILKPFNRFFPLFILNL